MKIGTIENIFKFLQNNEGKEIPKKFLYSIKELKLIEELKNHPDGTQYRYNGKLDLFYSNIKKLPNDLYVVGSLDLGNCKQLTKLPDKLHVDGYFSIRDTNIEELPNNLYVDDDFDLDQTNIKELPDNLYVGRHLWIYNTPLARKYTDEEIYKIVASTGGQITGKISRNL